MGKGSFKLPIASGGGGQVEITRWQRPAEWLTLPSVTDGEEKIVILMGLVPDGDNRVALILNSGLDVDMGDGTVYTNVSSVNHTYDFDSRPNQDYTAEGYKQCIITITPNIGGSGKITDFNGYWLWSGNDRKSQNFLEIKLASKFINDFHLGNPTNSADYFFPLLESVEWVGSNPTPWNGEDACKRAYNLRRAIFPFETCTDTSYMFSECRLLTEIGSNNVINLDNALNYLSMFSDANELEKITINIPEVQPAGAFTTAASSMFIRAHNLRQVFFTGGSWITSLDSFLNTTSMLTEVDLSNFTGITTVSSLCYKSGIRKITLPINISNVGCYQMFRECHSLEEVINFDTWKPNRIDYLCFENYNLKKLCDVLDLSLISYGNVEYVFNDCYSLQLPIMTFPSVVYDIREMFRDCVTSKVFPFAPSPAVHDFSNLSDVSAWSIYLTSLVEIPNVDVSTWGNATFAINSCQSLQRIGVTGLGQGHTNVQFQSNNLAQKAIVEIFNNLEVVTTITHNIYISQNPGSAALTAPEIAIATDKGWTVIT